ncbi:hypothetical protein HG531_000005 [Fusarium graminearum]|nr:hypothetical protein HG531_000005 [Fusarium graminearum]
MVGSKRYNRVVDGILCRKKNVYRRAAIIVSKLSDFLDSSLSVQERVSLQMLSQVVNSISADSISYPLGSKDGNHEGGNEIDLASKTPGEMSGTSWPIVRPNRAPASIAGMIIPDGTLQPKVMVEVGSTENTTKYPTADPKDNKDEIVKSIVVYAVIRLEENKLACSSRVQFFQGRRGYNRAKATSPKNSTREMGADLLVAEQNAANRSSKCNRQSS